MVEESIRLTSYYTFPKIKMFEQVDFTTNYCV